MLAKVGVDQNRDGFTMIEVIVTLVILAVLAAFAIPTYMGFVKDSQAKECAAYTAMLTRDCQQAQKELTDSPTRRVLIDKTQRNEIFYGAIFDEFNVDLQTGPVTNIKIIDEDGKEMVAGICQDGGYYYTQSDNGNINVYCDKHDNHDGMIPDVNPDVVDSNNVTINYQAIAGGSVSIKTETIDASTGTPGGSTASANAGYTFVNWTRNGIEVYDKPTFKPTNNESATYTANFRENEVTITYEAKTDGTVSPGGSVSPISENIKALTGTAVGSTATPNGKYKFVGWFDSTDTQVEQSVTFYPEKINGAYIPATYTARFVAIGSVGTIGDVDSYFSNADQNWRPIWDLNWDPVTWNFTWYNARTEIGVVYSYTNWLIEWGWMEDAGTYVSVGKLNQDFSGWFASTDNFYRALSPERQKKFIKITDSTPLYKYKPEIVAGSIWLVAPPTFGNLYEYGDAVYIWTSENASIIPPTNPTASDDWVKIKE